jgi:hypothetical protein
VPRVVHGLSRCHCDDDYWRVKLVGRPGWKRRNVPVHAYVLIYRAGNTPAVVYKIHRDLLNRLGKLDPIYMHGNYRIQSQQHILNGYKSITVNITCLFIYALTKLSSILICIRKMMHCMHTHTHWPMGAVCIL